MADRQVVQYYAALKRLSQVYDRTARRMPAPQDSLDALMAWQSEARAAFHGVLGLDLMEGCALEPVLLSTQKGDGYRMERVRIASAPGLNIPLTVLVPEGLSPGEKRPALLHAFGHGSPQTMADAFLPAAGEGSPIDRALRSIGIGPAGLKILAKEGYLVIAADSRASGERLDFAGSAGECVDIGADNPMNNIAAALGMSKVGMEVWDLMRMADYALSRPDCDGRIGTAGTSGGGHQSLFFAAADPRVTLAATSTWFYGFKDALIDQAHNCSCNYVPGLFTLLDCCDIGSLVAPRPLHVETGWRDSLSSRMTGLGNVLSQLELTRQSYRLFGAEDNLSLWVFDGGHGCNPWDNEDKTVPQSGAAFAPFVRAHFPLDRKEAAP